eukprot:7250718-Alexandrium_andersonii.AAC.1
MALGSAACSWMGAALEGRTHGRRPGSAEVEWPAAAAPRLPLRAAESGVATPRPPVAGGGRRQRRTPH